MTVKLRRRINMSLLNASLAAGILLVALPIVLHLIMRQRPKYLQFPALRFIQKKQEANRRKLQLRHWLLLALRCAAIGLLALALARPSITGSGVLGKEGAPIAAALVFDTSPRMEYRHENLTRLEAAQELADWLLSRLPPETAVSVMDSSGSQRLFAVDHGAAAQQVERLSTSATSRPLHEAVSDAIHLVRSKPEYRHEVYVFTDLSVAAWDEEALRAVGTTLGDDEDLNLYVIDVGVQNARNVGIAAVRLADDVVARTADIPLEAALVASGGGQATDIELLLEDEDGNLQKRDQKRIDWQEDGSATAQFTLSGLPEGTHQGMLRIAAQDALAVDDKRFFTIDVRPPPAVLILAADEREAVFLQQALAPRDHVKTGRARFHCDVVRFEQATGQMLSRYAAVCLVDPPPLAEPLWDALAAYAAEGGGVAIFLGHHAVGHLEAFNAEHAQALLAGPLVRVWHEPAETYLSPDGYDHPSLARFRRHTGEVPWHEFPVVQFWQLKDLHSGAAAIISYANSDRMPAVVERPIGSGLAVTMTTPVSHAPNQRSPEPWNYLPAGFADLPPWPFYVLMQDLVGYVAGTGENRLNYTAGETATIRLTPPEHQEVQGKKGNYVVRTPSQESLVRSLRTGDDTVTFTSTSEPGNYRVVAGGRTGVLKRGFTANLPPGASRLERASPDQIASALGKDRVRFARRPNEIEISIGLGRLGRELFPWMIGVLVVILAGEHLAANRFYKE